MNDEEKKARTEAAEPYNEEEHRAAIWRHAKWAQEYWIEKGKPERLTDERIAQIVEKEVARVKANGGHW